MITQTITCPHCNTPLLADKQVASMAEVRRLERKLVDMHIQHGRCTKVKPETKNDKA